MGLLKTKRHSIAVAEAGYLVMWCENLTFKTKLMKTAYDVNKKESRFTVSATAIDEDGSSATNTVCLIVRNDESFEINTWYGKEGFRFEGSFKADDMGTEPLFIKATLFAISKAIDLAEEYVKEGRQKSKK